MSIERVRDTSEGIAADDPFYTEPASDEELRTLLTDAADIRETLETVDTAIDRYRANVARRGRLAGLQDYYDADEQVIFFDAEERVIDSFVIAERQAHLDEEVERLRDEIACGVDRLQSWHPDYGVDGALRQLYGTARMTMGEGRVDAEQLDRAKEAVPDAFFTLLEESSGGTYNRYATQLLNRYIDASGQLQSDGRYGTLAAVEEYGCMALETAFQEDAEQERAYVHVLHENQEQHVDDADEPGVTAPTAYRVEKIRAINEVGEDAYNESAERMFH